MFVRWKCSVMSGSMLINRAGLLCLSLSAFVLLPGALLFAQQDEKRPQDDERRSGRAAQLERIEEAIRRLEQQIPELQGEEGEGRWRQALEGLELRKLDRYALGISLSIIQEEDEDSITVAVQEVTPDSAADKAGFQAGDVIVAVNGEELQGPEQLIAAVQATKGEKPLQIEVLRDEESITLEATPTRQEPQDENVGQFQWRLLEDGGEKAIVIPQIPQLGPMLLPENVKGLQTEVEQLRADVDKLRAQMKEMSTLLKELQAALKDRDSK